MNIVCMFPSMNPQDDYVRGVGQPETTTWSVDTGGEESIVYSLTIGEVESYIAKLFSKDLFTETPQLQPRRVAQASTVCQ